MKRRQWSLLAVLTTAAACVGAQTAEVTPPLLAGSYYIGDGGITVMDVHTGLMWQRCQLGRKWNGETCRDEPRPLAVNWAAAKALRSNLAGYDDWRLPEKDELKSLVACRTGPAAPLPDNTECNKYSRPTIDLEAFPGTHSSFFWSSTAAADQPDEAWGVEFADGRASINYQENHNEVRLVRRPR